MKIIEEYLLMQSDHKHSRNHRNEKVNKTIENAKEKSQQEEKRDPKVVNGYLILLDMVDSTKRKKLYIELNEHWTNHINLFYSEFFKSSDELMGEIEAKLEGDERDKKNKFIKAKVVVKVIGDMGFLFLPFESQPIAGENRKADCTISKLILEDVIESKKKIESKESPPEIPELKLKTIVTYLYDVYLVDLIDLKGNQMTDVIGKGIDFSFRLEKFANSSCIILNKYFYQSVIQLAVENQSNRLDEKKLKFGDEEYFVYQGKKNIKSWEKEEFYYLTNQKMIEDNFENSKSSDSEDSIVIDLFSKYISYKKN